MEDELDDRVLYQTYVSHMKIMSRFLWSVPLNFNISPTTYLNYVWRLLKVYILKPEILLFGTIVIVMLMYLQAVDVWSRTLLGRLQSTLSMSRTRTPRLGLLNTAEVERASWQLKSGAIGVYAVQGRRPKMEDRFVVNQNINDSGVLLLAVFDGHGGEFAANYAKDKLMPSLLQKVAQIKGILQGTTAAADVAHSPDDHEDVEPKPLAPAAKKPSFRKTASTTDECAKSKEVTDVELVSKLESLQKAIITREARPSRTPSTKRVPITHYFDKEGIIDYGKLITDEVLAADRLLLESAKRAMDVAGTTALIAIMEESKLYVANVGDSRGVMCDSRGNAIPLSFDHKPQQMRERKRIQEAGGFVTFNGVWRVAGILATSRALGDYPLKDKNLVIADPDILTFDLRDHKPLFVILASDGLWDTFTNEEAIAFIKDHLNEPDYGAKSITLQSYYRGSLDNITVMIINFRDGTFSWQKMTPNI